MKILIELNGVLRGLAGADAVNLELPTSATAADALSALETAHPALAPRLRTTACAVGDALVPRSAALSEGSRLVLIPPVSGG